MGHTSRQEFAPKAFSGRSLFATLRVEQGVTEVEMVEAVFGYNPTLQARLVAVINSSDLRGYQALARKKYICYPHLKQSITTYLRSLYGNSLGLEKTQSYTEFRTLFGQILPETYTEYKFRYA